MLLLPRGVWTPAAAWALAPPPKKKEAAWVRSWERFSRGEPVDAIAMTQESGKAIQSSTVVGHLLLALQAGSTRTLTPNPYTEHPTPNT